SKRPKRSASKFQTSCWPSPTRLSNDREDEAARVHHAHRRRSRLAARDARAVAGSIARHSMPVLLHVDWLPYRRGLVVFPRAGHMRRQGFITIFFLAVIALSSGVAQERTKPYRIGVLSPAERTTTRVFDGLRQGLRERGYIDGQNIIIEYR